MILPQNLKSGVKKILDRCREKESWPISKQANIVNVVTKYNNSGKDIGTSKSTIDQIAEMM